MTGAVKKFDAIWKAELERISFAGAKRMFGHCPQAVQVDIQV